MFVLDICLSRMDFSNGPQGFLAICCWVCHFTVKVYLLIYVLADPSSITLGC